MKRELTIGPKIFYGGQEIGDVQLGGRAYVHINPNWYVSVRATASVVSDLFHDLPQILEAITGEGYSFSAEFEERERQHLEHYTIPAMMRDIYVACWKRTYGSDSWPPDLQQHLNERYR